MNPRTLVALIFVVWLGASARAAQFDGSSRLEITDPSSALSWNTSANALTVECWFKLSVPSTVTLTKNMVILANARTHSPSGSFAYAVQYNINSGNVEFTAGGGNGQLAVQTLVTRPYLERWYHVAVTRSGAVFTGYLDGRQQFSVTNDIGSSVNSKGLFIGGTPDDGDNLYGEVQEVAVYQTVLTQDTIIDYMFQSQPTLTQTTLQGYYTLDSTAVTNISNSALVPPSGTTPANKVGNVTFDVTSLSGEQSTFDANKNGGRDAQVPLAGGYSWQHSLFHRGTRGIPMDFQIGYTTANALNGVQIPQFPAFDTNGLGAGWSHTFDVRIVPSEVFQPAGSASSVGLLLWDGSLVVWDYNDAAGSFLPRDGAYHGELTFSGFPLASDAKLIWTTPARLQYVFNTPYAGPSSSRGRLAQIRDFNASPNVITLARDTFGFLQTVTDTAGGVLSFKYDAQNRLTYVGYLGSDPLNPLWKVSFTYNAQNRLATFALTGPAAYTSSPALPTTWGFYYKSTSDSTNGLLEKVADPRGYNAGSPSYYSLTLAYDTYGRVVSQTDALNRVNQTKYNTPAVRQVSRIDPYQAAQTTPKPWIDTFDRKNHIISKQDPLGNLSSFELDAAGNVTASVDANSNRTEFTYDARANPLTKRNVAFNQITTWQYNATLGNTAFGVFPLNKATQELDPPAVHSGAAPAGWVTTYNYDAAGNLLTQSDALGTLVTNTYFPNGLAQSTADGNGSTTSFTYTAEGFMASKTVPDVGNAIRTWTYTSTELGWPLTQQDPVQPQSQFFQDINGNTVKVIDPEGRTFAKVFDANGNLITDTDAKLQSTLYTYDNAGQRLTMQQRDHTAAAPRIWTYGYTPRGEQQFVRDPSQTGSNNTATYAFDDAGRRISETDANNFTSATSYDAVGNVRFTTGKDGSQWEKRYDALNRVMASIDPQGNTTATTYDNAGRLDTITDPKNNIIHHAYDGRSRLLQLTDAQGFTWTYTYDGAANIRDIQDARQGHYTMTYGPRNERLTETNQDGKTWTYAYDPLLRLQTQADPSGISRSLSYDNGSRVDTVAFSTGRTTIFFYDDNNNPTEVRRIAGGVTTKTTLTFDSMDRILSANDTFSKVVSYTYDAAGRLLTTTYPGGKTLTRGYDLAGRLSGLVDWASRPSSFAYDKEGRLTSHTYPNGITTTYAYDNAGRVTNLNQGTAATPAQIALRYAYDRNGNKTSEQKAGVLNWQPGTAAGQVAEFDETYTPSASGRLGGSADAKNPARATAYQYSDSGNMTSAVSNAVSTSFTYDEDNRVTQVSYTAPPLLAQTVVNRYDALGRRISRTLTSSGASTETRYTLDLVGGMERILCDTDSGGNITARYVHGPDGLGYKEDASTSALTCYHADATGNIIRLTDATGTDIADYAYTPYGRTLATTGTAASANPYRFVGSQGVMQEFPNLYFMRARYYSADSGVFLSVDPVKNLGAGGNTQAYAYAGGNPMRYSDPEGTTITQQTVDRIREYNNEQVQYEVNAANADAWTNSLEATSDALTTSLAFFTGNEVGVVTGLSRQAAGVLNAVGLSDASKSLRFAADATDVLYSIRDLINVRDTITSVSYIKGQITKRGLAAVGNFSSETKTALRVAELAGISIEGILTAEDAYYNPVLPVGSSISTSPFQNSAAACYANSANASQSQKIAPVASNPNIIAAGALISVGGSSGIVNGNITYRIKPGDTLSSIAAMTGNTVATLQAVNGIPNADKITAGSLIKAPYKP